MLVPEMSTLSSGAYGSHLHSSRWHCDRRLQSHLIKCGWIPSAGTKKEQTLLLKVSRENSGPPFHSCNGVRWGSPLIGFGKGRMPKRMLVRAPSGSRNITTIIAAISVPLLLVAITVIVSIIVADKLAEEYVEEIARKRAQMEKNGTKEDIILGGGNEEKESVLSRPRNRPKREE